MIYAKIDPIISLRAHTLGVIEEMMFYLEVNSKKLQKICNLTNYDPEKAKDLLFFAAFFHDFGKATEEFQGMICSNNKNLPQNYLNRKPKYTRHEFYSLIYVELIKDFMTQLSFKKSNFSRRKTREKIINLLYLTVATHHKALQKDLFLDSKYKNQFTFITDELNRFLNELPDLFMQFRNRKYDYEFKLPENECSQTDFQKNIHYMLDDNIQLQSLKKCRDLFCFLGGALNIADWRASAKQAEDKNVSIYWNKLPDYNYIKKRLKQIWNIKETKLYEFQEELSETKGNVLVEIPTGEGKTEGSLLWAANNLSSVSSKIIYTLPTQVTSNKLYDRMSELFGNENCGLIHSSSDLKIIESYLEEEEYKSERNWHATFSKPLTVSTLDGFFKYFANIGRYSMSMNNIFDSVVIFDEIHIYDMKMLGFLKKILECLQEYKIPWCIMSASIPNILKKFLFTENIKYDLVTQKKLFNKKANKLFIKDKSIVEDINFISNKVINEKKNVLVVCNTVNDARKAFDLLQHRKVESMLYHSTFTKEHRQLKEQEIFYRLDILNEKKKKKGKIKKPKNEELQNYFDSINKQNFVLVATQVVEISLDIDFDILITEVSPIDSLIQRFGRVNRKKSFKRRGEIYIYKKINSFKNAKDYPYDEVKYYPYPGFILQKSFDVLREGYHELSIYNDWLNISTNEILKDKLLKEEQNSKFCDGYEKYNSVLQNSSIYVNRDYNLRDIDDNLTKIPCWLNSDYRKFQAELFSRSGKRKLIDIPMWLWKKLKDLGKVISTDEKQYYDIVQLNYSYAKGLMINDKTFELNNII